jgi:lipopolysaccharide export system permease protein
LGENLTRDVNEGLWSKEGNEYVHMGAVEPNGRLHSLTRYRYDETGHLESNSYAETALYQGGHWLEENIVETVFDGPSIATVNYAMREWRTSITPELLNLLTLDPNAMATQALFDFARYREDQGFSADEHWLAFWTKALQPLATVSLVLVAIAFIFGPLRQTTTGFRVFIGVMVGVGFRTVQALLGPSSLVFDFPPVIAVAVPIAVCAALGVWVLKNYR